MDLDSEEAKFFGRTDDLGTLPPTKRPRPEGESSTYPMTKGKGKGKKGKGKGRSKESPPPPTWDYTNGLDVWTRLVLQQEQTIASLRQDVTLYLFVKTGQGSIVTLLHQTAEKWRREKEDSPHTLTYSLKIAMFKQLMIELHGRLTAVAKAPEEMEKAKKLNWVDERD